MAKIQITLDIPEDYKWIALNAWGEWLAFKNKPKVIKSEAEGEYWDLQSDELSLSDCGPKAKGNEWKISLMPIGKCKT